MGSSRSGAAGPLMRQTAKAPRLAAPFRSHVSSGADHCDTLCRRELDRLGVGGSPSRTQCPGPRVLKPDRSESVDAKPACRESGNNGIVTGREGHDQPRVGPLRSRRAPPTCKHRPWPGRARVGTGRVTGGCRRRRRLEGGRERADFQGGGGDQRDDVAARPSRAEHRAQGVPAAWAEQAGGEGGRAHAHAHAHASRRTRFVCDVAGAWTSDGQGRRGAF